MATENTYTEATKTFEENVAKGMQWMQDTNAKLVETQKQQMKAATDAFSKVLESFKLDGKSNNSFGAGSNSMTDFFQKNVEISNNVFKTFMKQATDFSKFSDKDEMQKQLDSFTKQIADLTIVNQNNFDLILKQFDETTKSFAPLTEQFIKELEKAAISSQETLQTIIGSYSAFAVPFMDGNKETFDKINEQIKTAVNENIKFWSDIMNPKTTTTRSTEKTPETKTDNGLLKLATGGNKKQVPVNSNHNHN